MQKTQIFAWDAAPTTIDANGKTYRKQSFPVSYGQGKDAYTVSYGSVYPVGHLFVALHGENGSVFARILENRTRKALGNAVLVTATPDSQLTGCGLEKLFAGVEEINARLDFSTLIESKEAFALALPVFDDVWPRQFGQEYDTGLFGRAFMRAVARTLDAIKRL